MSSKVKIWDAESREFVTVRKLALNVQGDKLGGAKTQGKPEYFLSGPISWLWLTTASRLPGRAVSVGLALWYMAGRCRTRADISLSNILVSELGIDADAKRRGLLALEQAGLVSVVRKGKAAPRVTLLVTK